MRALWSFLSRTALAASILSALAACSHKPEGKPEIRLVIEQRLAQPLKPEIERFSADLRAEGYDVSVESSLQADAKPASIRSALQSWFDDAGAPTGAILVGEFAAPLFNDAKRTGDPYWHDQLVDLYYMDLDGAWIDANSDGVFETHRSFEGRWVGRIASRVTKQWLPSLDRRQPDIWVSRLRAGTLAPLGDELTLYREYFARNHAYRTGKEPVAPRAFMVAGGPRNGVRFSTSGWGARPQELYSDVDVHECKDNVSGVLRDKLSDPQGWSIAVIGSMSGPRMHAFHTYEGEHIDQALWQNREGRQQITNYLDQPRSPWDVTSSEIAGMRPKALLYHLLASETGRHDEENYLGGVYLFFGHGLAVIAGTQHSGSIGVPALYDALARRSSVGDAWREAMEWSLVNWGNVLEFHWCEGPRPWDPSADPYRAVLLGDGTLRLPTTKVAAN